jgi:hypothetical protein
MDDIGSVHEVHRTEHAVDDGDHVILGELKLWHRLEDLLHISLHELHDDKDIGNVGTLWGNDVEDFGGEAVVLHLGELPQDLDLANDFFRVVLALEDVVDELDSYFLSRFSMFGLDNLTIASLTDEFDELIVIEGVSPYWGQGHHVGLVAHSGAITGLGRLVTHVVVPLAT